MKVKHYSQLASFKSSELLTANKCQLWNYKCGSTSADSFLQCSANLEIRRARSLNEQAFLKAVVVLIVRQATLPTHQPLARWWPKITKVSRFPSPFSYLAQPYQIWQAFVNFLEVLFRKAYNLGEFGSTEGPESNQLDLANSGVGGGGE